MNHHGCNLAAFLEDAPFLCGIGTLTQCNDDLFIYCNDEGHGNRIQIALRQSLHGCSYVNIIVLESSLASYLVSQRNRGPDVRHHINGTHGYIHRAKEKTQTRDNIYNANEKRLKHKSFEQLINLSALWHISGT
jgi:hypothetical protein